MKKLFIVLCLIVLSSCTNTPTKVDNPKLETTVELQQLACIDTTFYKVVEKDDTVYIINPKTQLVEKKLHNYTGLVGGFGITILIFMLIIILLMVIFAD